LNFKHGSGGQIESRRSLPVLHFIVWQYVAKLLAEFYVIQAKIDWLLQFEFFHNGGCRHPGFDDR
jgi:hypothetical protein